MTNKHSDRRRFLKESAALAGLALGATRFAGGETTDAEASQAHLKDLHAYGQRSRFEKSVRLGHNGFERVKTPEAILYGYGGTLTPLQDLEGTITPSSLHYFVHHNYEPPDIDPREHRLMIHGLVDRPLMFTMADLRRLPSVSRLHFLECRGNSDPQKKERKTPGATAQIMHGQTSCSEWTGVLLSLLLKEAGVQKGASWLLAEGADQHKMTRSIPLEKGMDDVLVAYGQNGEAVRPDQGYPLRMVVPGWEGNSNVKWLRRIKVVDQPYMTRPETVQYPDVRPGGTGHWFNFQLGPKSVITRPSGGHQLPGRGFYEITGLAWSGGGAVRKVEVSTDGGKTWKDAQLQEPTFRKAHARFRFGWNWNGEETVIQSRCTDDNGDVQPTMSEIATIWGLAPDYFQSKNFQTAGHFGHFNAIQPWKVNRDGSVQNAMFS
jgi:sulfane dehydrogenase subunit SoxC